MLRYIEHWLIIVCFCFCVFTPFLFDGLFQSSPYGVRNHFLDEPELIGWIVLTGCLLPVVLEGAKHFGSEHYWNATIVTFSMLVPIYSYQYGAESPHDFVLKSGFGMAAIVGLCNWLNWMYDRCVKLGSVQEAISTWAWAWSLAYQLVGLTLLALGIWNVVYVYTVPLVDRWAATVLVAYSFLGWSTAAWLMPLRMADRGRTHIEDDWLNRTKVP